MNVGCYIRVSSTEQADEGYSVQSQTDKLKAYCLAMDYMIYDMYIDPGFTGANLNRPGMQRLIRDVTNKKLDMVIVMKLDRLSRSQKDTLYLIEDVFAVNNCSFVSVTESFDTSTPMGKAFIGILAVFAQFERERIKDRTEDGKMERAKSGKVMGWYKTPIGYDYKDGQYYINEYEAAIVRRAFDLSENGHVNNDIVKILEQEYPSGTKYTIVDNSNTYNFTASTIKRMLSNKTYIGIVKFKGKEFPGDFQPIIKTDQFERVQVIQKARREEGGNNKMPFASTHLLTGLLYCEKCGARMHAQTRKRVNDGKSYYICYARSKTYKNYIRYLPECDADIIDGKTLDDYVTNQIAQLQTSKDYLKFTKQQDVDEPDNIALHKNKLSEINKKLDKLMDLYLIGAMDKDAIAKKNKALTNEKELVIAAINKNEKRNKRMSGAEIGNLIDRFVSLPDDAPIQERKALISTLISHVNIGETGINITWTF